MSKAAIELLKVLIEETHEESESVKTFFIDTIDLDAIYGSMFKWRVRNCNVFREETDIIFTLV